ncbi:MAG: hypothetical protein CMD18_00010 [Flavobacteriales bacterium]|nr:hypothetical protein [Flavobacteriales bacterium]|tara:strand:+ start:1416 stop:11810 length:10395 start_codon:yes stop_codon:yes gene_type:complete
MYAFSSLTFGQSTSKKSFASALTSGGGGISQAALARADAVASQTAGGIDKDLEDKINSLQKDSGYDGNAKKWTLQSYRSAAFPEGPDHQKMMIFAAGTSLLTDITRFYVSHVEYSDDVNVKNWLKIYERDDYCQVRLLNNREVIGFYKIKSREDFDEGINGSQGYSLYRVEMLYANDKRIADKTGQQVSFGFATKGHWKLEGDNLYFNDGSEAYKGFIGVGTKTPENLVHIKNVHSDRKANLIIENFSTDASGADAGIIFRNDVSGNSAVGTGKYENHIYTGRDGRMVMTTENDRDFVLQRNGGYVGVGILQPESLLHLKNIDNSKTAKIILENSSTDAGEPTTFILRNDVNGNVYNSNILTAVDGRMELATENDRDMLLQKTGGKIGVGIAQPEVLFHIKNSNNAKEARMIIENSSTDASGADVYLTLRNDVHSTQYNNNIYTTRNGRFVIDTEGGRDLCIQRVSGKVGLGILQPESLFHIKNTDDSLEAKMILENSSTDVNGADTKFILRNNNNGTIYNNNIYTTTEGKFVMATEESRDLILQREAGRVGIGTHYPEALFHIKNVDDNKTAQMILENKSTDLSGADTYFTIRNDVNTVQYDNHIYTGRDGRMVITTENKRDLIIQREDGFVGIGLLEPDRVLHIRNKDNQYDTTVMVDNIATDHGGKAMIELKNTINYDTVTQTGTSFTNYIYTKNNGNLVLETGGTNKLALQPMGGFTGIGTENPETLLHVQNLDDNLTGHMIVENKTAYDSIGDDAIMEIRNTTSGSSYKSFIIGDESGRFIIKTEHPAEPVVYQPDEGSVGYGVYDPEATVHIKNINENKRSHLMIQNTVNNPTGQALFELRTTTTTHDYRSFVYNKQDGKFILTTNLFGVFMEKTGEMTVVNDFIGTQTATVTFLEEEVESTTRSLTQSEINELLKYTGGIPKKLDIDNGKIGVIRLPDIYEKFMDKNKVKLVKSTDKSTFENTLTFDVVDMVDNSVEQQVDFDLQNYAHTRIFETVFSDPNMALIVKKNGSANQDWTYTTDPTGSHKKLTFTRVVENETITIKDHTTALGTVTFTSVISNPTGNEYLQGNNKVERATNFAAKVNATISTYVTAVADNGVVTLTSLTANPPSNYPDLCMQISGGKVGLGTEEPESLFHIKNIDDTLESKFIFENKSTDASGADTMFTIRNDVSGNVYDNNIYTGTDGRFIIDAENTRDVVLQRNTGRVGIGVHQPESLLHVKNTTNTKEAKLLLQNKANDGGQKTIIELNNINGVSNEYNFSNLIYTDIDGKFIVKTDTNNRDLGIQIDGGQVGIGTKTPETLFHIKNIDDNKISKMILENKSTDASGADTYFTIRNDVSGNKYDNHLYTGTDGRMVMDTEGSRDLVFQRTSGKVGLGLLQPESLFHIRNTDDSLECKMILENKSTDAGSDTYLTIRNDNDGTKHDNHIYTTTDGKMVMTTESIRDLILQRTAGQVGVGTFVPEALFHIKNSDDTKISKMILENSSTDDGADTQFTIRNNVSGVIYDNHILTQVDGKLFIKTDGSRDLILQNSGSKVGIGTQTPSEMLEINGQVHCQGLKGDVISDTFPGTQALALSNKVLSSRCLYDRIETLIGTAPAVLDTLGEIAAYINQSASLTGFTNYTQTLTTVQANLQTNFDNTGDIVTLNTQDKSTIVNSLNEIHDEVGTLDGGTNDELITDTKQTIVKAINELHRDIWRDFDDDANDATNMVALKTEEKVTIVKSINEIHDDVGTLTDLTTTNKSNIVASINELDLDVGHRTDLNTETQVNIVSSINEIHDDVGTINTLNTETKATVVAAMNEIHDDVGTINTLKTEDKSTVVAAMNEIHDDVGTINTLNTETKATVVAAMNEIHDDVGTINTLTTTDQTTVVAAINELDTDIGHRTNLITDTQVNIVSAINELHSDIWRDFDDDANNTTNMVALKTEEKVTIVKAINEIHDDVGTLTDLTTTVKSTIVASINELDVDVGHRTDLNTETQTNIVSSINEIHDDVGTINTLNTETKATVVAAVNEIHDDVGTINTLNTETKSTVVAAINEIHDDVGTINTLTTTDQTTVVAAINELDTDIGNRTSLSTTDKTNIVTAINELHTEIGDRSALGNGTETNLVSAINSEKTRAETAETNISQSITDLKTEEIDWGPYSATGDLPNATTKHGMFAHVHGTGAAYFAHSGNWVELTNKSDTGEITSLDTANKTNVVTAINELHTEIGNRTTLANGFANNLVDAINAERSRALAVEGPGLSSLTTSDQNSIIDAINELDEDIGNRTTLNTASKTNMVSAINELHTEIGDRSSLANGNETNLVTAINTERSRALTAETNLSNTITNLKSEDIDWGPYSSTGDLPSATNNHGMFAHVHGTGAAYYAHGGNWIELSNKSTVDSITTTSNNNTSNISSVTTTANNNASNISTITTTANNNTNNISTNTSNISTNTNNISTNTSNVSSLTTTVNNLSSNFSGTSLTATSLTINGTANNGSTKDLNVTGDINFTGKLYQNGSEFTSGGGGGGGGGSGTGVDSNNVLEIPLWTGSGGTTYKLYNQGGTLKFNGQEIGTGGGGGGAGSSSGNTGTVAMGGASISNTSTTSAAMMGETPVFHTIGSGDFVVEGAGADANLDIKAETGNSNINFQVADGTVGTLNYNTTQFGLNKKLKVTGDLEFTGTLYKDGVEFGGGVFDGVQYVNGTNLSIYISGDKNSHANADGDGNIAIGKEALYSAISASSNIAIGAYSLKSLSNTGYNNVCIGISAGFATTDGKKNVAIGHRAMNQYTTGDHNIAIGTESLSDNTGGGNNIAIGYEALHDSGAFNNIGLGAYAGMYNSSGNRNVCIGYYSGPKANQTNLNDRLYIDVVSARRGTSSFIYGHMDATNPILVFNAKVGIGKDSPGEHLDVSGNINFTGTLKQDGVEFGGGKFEDGATSGNIYYNGGNVGIGTTSPDAKLEIHGGPLGLKNGNHTATTAQQILFGYNGVNNLEYAHSIRTRHNGQSSGNDTQNSIDFYLWKKGDTTTTIGEKHGMSITAAGVGIGRTDPTQVLDVKFPDATSGDDPLFIQATRIGLGNAGVGFRAGTGYWDAFWEHTHGSPDRMNFGMYRAGSGKQVYMTLTHEGRLGIGTDSPDYHLDIRGTGYVSQNIYSDNTGWAATRYGSNGGSNELLYVGAANDGTCFVNSRSDYPLCFLQNDSEKMRIHDNGYVGIGEASPEAQLHIYSGIQCMRMVVPYNNKYFQTNFYYGGHHIDVYYHGSTKGMGSSGNGGTLHLNYYSGGTVTINQVNQTSDDRLKHNEKIITNGLDIINQLEPKKYFKSLKRYDEDHNYDLDSSGNPITDDDYKIETGLIAQQVMIIDDLKYTVDEVEDKYKTVEKETLDENGDVILDDDGKPVIEKKEEIALKGRYTVKYQDIFVYNIAATQELDRQLQDQMGKNNALHQDMEEYKQTMDDKMDMVLNQMSALMEENNALKLRIKWLEEK